MPRDEQFTPSIQIRTTGTGLFNPMNDLPTLQIVMSTQHLAVSWCKSIVNLVLTIEKVMAIIHCYPCKIVIVEESRE